ncbi:PepSY-associated TM helix domain-containing protein [Steroidobacter sp.]|uniref:PepSY-associated TM helix domain-containing protein n=1 Tax=Steroidobacter sp. TaxID=1978227 RepID=UPI001A4BE6EF|nr:PepSY-associated TM helix domain-containing protein [Steroidobacter sp.]MBL8269676.1 PepSY domain-containing protein [Steroidobacter sp.]
MKDGFRQCMAWLHTWSGLIVGWVLFFVFVTGSAGYFQAEISRWMRPELPIQNFERFVDQAPVLDVALDRLQEVAPVAASWSITLPHYSLAAREWQGLSIRWEEMPKDGHENGASGTEQLDPETGALYTQPEPRATAGGVQLYRMHYSLHYMPAELAYRIVGVCTMLMLLAIITGVITHKKIFKDFFTFRPAKGQRSWLDAHNVVSVLVLPFFLLITYSGLVFFQVDYMPAGVNTLYGSDDQSHEKFFDEYFDDEHHHVAIGRPPIALAPLLKQAEAQWGPGTVRTVTIEHMQGEEPVVAISKVFGGSVKFGDTAQLRFNAQTGEPLPPEHADSASRQTHDVMLALHEGRFADTWTRWLYFVAGLLGCTMIGTGLVLWTVKRRKQHLAAPNTPVWEGFGLRLVETLNVATLAGLPLGIAAYFWANRLLPIELSNRPDWELDALFATWLCTFFVALLRPLKRAWLELLWTSCGAFALLPVLNFFTTDRHLGVSLAQGDWVMAGVDLTFWGLALLFGFIAYKVNRKMAIAQSAAKPAHSEIALDGAGGSRA